MNFIVIGLGSMGKRRVRLLQEYFAAHEGTDGWEIAGIDSVESRMKETEELYGIKTYKSISDAVAAGHFDHAVISTSPLSHAPIIKDCLEHDLNVFTELNLVDTAYEENMALSAEKGKVLFLSSTPMYRREMQYIKEHAVKELFAGKKGEYHFHIGQYLPEWHPWEDYRKFFVSSKKTSGCRELFAIELPWLIDTFGEIESVYSIHNRVSDLEIDYDDSYTVIIKHASGFIGNLSIDVVTPKAGREFELWGENVYVEWKGTPDSLKVMDPATKELRNVALYESFDQKEGYNKFVIENAYYDELVNFVEVIRGENTPRYSFERDKELLKIIDKIEE